MATDHTYHSLVELAKRTDPQGNMATLIDLLAEKNPMLEEAHWEEGNGINSHEFTQIIAEPTPGFGRINKDIPFSGEQTKQVVEPICYIPDALRVDSRLLKLSGHPDQYMREAAEIHIKALGKAAHKALLYGNRGTDPDAINGFMTRLNALSLENVLDGGGSGSDTASILVVKWGRNGVYFAYPKGFSKFLEETGPDRVWVSDNSARGGHWAEIMTWGMNVGLCIEKPKNVQRIANIETSGSSNTFDEDLLIEALDNMDDTDGAVIYVPKKILTQMKIKLKDKSNVNFTIEEAWGRRNIMHFQGVPIKACDQMLITETAIA